MKKKKNESRTNFEIATELLVEKGVETFIASSVRQTIAIEKISRHLSAIEECLLHIVDGNRKTLRVDCQIPKG